MSVDGRTYGVRVPETTAARRTTLIVLLVGVIAVLTWSVIDAYRLTIWIQETIWAVLGLVVVLATWRRFPLTTLLCVLLAAWAAVLAYGGHTTYASAPLGRWIEHWYGGTRNPWDRVGHFMQGFAPAILVREVLWRRSPLRGTRWLNPLAWCCCMALTACWELMEWGATEVTAHGSTGYLGGDIFDTQWDMFSCLIGAIIALTALSRWHDRQLRAVTGLNSPRPSAGVSVSAAAPAPSAASPATA